MRQVGFSLHDYIEMHGQQNKKKYIMVSRSKVNQYSSCQLNLEHQLLAHISLPHYKATDTELIGGLENTIIIQFISLFSYVLM